MWRDVIGRPPNVSSENRVPTNHDNSANIAANVSGLAARNALKQQAASKPGQSSKRTALGDITNDSTASRTRTSRLPRPIPRDAKGRLEEPEYIPEFVHIPRPPSPVLECSKEPIQPFGDVAMDQLWTLPPLTRAITPPPPPLSPDICTSSPLVLFSVDELIPLDEGEPLILAKGDETI